MPVTLLAPAKLTLSLRVTGVRDDGYHLIDAEMVSLDLYDRLEVDPAGDGLQVVRLDGSTVDGSHDDLVARALRAAGRAAGVVLHKRIPAGAGLGGGSSDAAAILRWAGVHDASLAAGIGADVAFCVAGGRARVRGIGELVEPLPYVHRTFTLLTPPIHASTPVVYRRWDELGGPRSSDAASTNAASTNAASTKAVSTNAASTNDLEPAALDAYPELARWRDELSDAAGQRAMLAGSGSTWFVEGAHPGPGRVVVTTVP